MGEAMLFAAEALPDGMVALGPLRFESPQPVAPGPVEAAVRPEAWTLGAPDGEGLPGTVAEFAYLGSVHEVTLDTAFGAIFVVAPALGPGWRIGDAVRLQLGGRGCR